MSAGGKGDARRPGKGYGAGFDLIWSKITETVKCPRCGAVDEDQCVCMPTDDGPGQSEEAAEGGA